MQKNVPVIRALTDRVEVRRTRPGDRDLLIRSSMNCRLQTASCGYSARRQRAVRR